MQIPPIPKEFYRHFWDCDASKLDPNQYPFYVIGRLLDRGGTAEVIWVLRHFSQDTIKDCILKYRDLSRKTGLFWQKHYQLPIDRVACLQTPYHPTRYGV